VTVNGHPGDLLDLTDRAKTLGGGIEITDTRNEVVATLTLPCGHGADSRKPATPA
jgi:hypothetical protein